jgi:CRISPR-associated exonuclease Cas4
LKLSKKPDGKRHGDISMYREDELVPLSALQHYVFCPRQCGLIHLEAIWEDNRLTAEGNAFHEKVDSGVPGRLPGVKIERSLPLRSLKLGLVGIADVVEFHSGDAGRRPYPVEYKRGKPRGNDRADAVQVCAQAMCLEEMFKTDISEGAVYYGEKRRRVEVAFTGELRGRTAAAADVHALFAAGVTPGPKPSPACKSCSLSLECLGNTVSRSASSFVANLFLEEGV